MVNTEIVSRAYREVEQRKKENGLRVGKVPNIFRHATWQRRVLGNDDILGLDYHIGIPNGSLDGSSKMFLEVQSTKIGELAAEEQKLRSLEDIAVSKWLSQIDDGLFALVKKDCPPLFILTLPMLVSGQIPDGNHRAFAAALLALKGEQIRIPAYEGSISPQKWLALNLFYFALGLKKDHALTLQVARERWRSRS